MKGLFEMRKAGGVFYCLWLAHSLEIISIHKRILQGLHGLLKSSGIGSLIKLMFPPHFRPFFVVYISEDLDL